MPMEIMVMVTGARLLSVLQTGAHPHRLVLPMGGHPHLRVLPMGAHPHQLVLLMGLLLLTGNLHQTFQMVPVTEAVAVVLVGAEAEAAVAA